MMKKFVVALSALTLSLSAGAALACGEGSCDGGTCSLEATDKAGGAPEAKPLSIKPGFTLATFKVDGMVCVNCANKVSATLKAIKGVDDVSVDLNAGKAAISYDQKLVNTEEVLKAVSKLHYHFTLL